MPAAGEQPAGPAGTRAAITRAATVGQGSTTGPRPGPLIEVCLSQAGRRAVTRHPPSLRRLIVQVTVAAIAMVSLVAVAGVEASRRAADHEAINYALEVTDLLAEGVVQPLLTDGLLTGEPQALDRLDQVMRSVILTRSLLRVKMWAADGRIVDSDEPQLIGRTFPLDDNERAALDEPSTRAELSDLTRPENTFERSQGKMLEVYRPVWTAQGTRLLFETYSRYAEVTVRARELSLSFAGIVLTTLLATVVMVFPLGWALYTRLRRSQQQREDALARAVEASDDERRRIAATLHDGVVQELSAISFVVCSAADQAARMDGHLAQRLRTVASGVRASIGGLRSLLVDVYPPTLRSAGIAAALSDLAGMLRPRGIDVTLDLADPDLDGPCERLVFRIAQEIIRNIGRHSGARSVLVGLARGEAAVTLTIADDGVGFDPREVVAAGRQGHFGLTLMTDLATEAGAHLCVAAAPGRGTRWRLEVPAR
jgi:signal transduction histidine kinase